MNKQKKQINWKLGLMLLPLLLLSGLMIFNEPILQGFAPTLSEKYAMSHYSDAELQQNQQQTSTYDYLNVEPLTPISYTRAMLSASLHPRKEVPVVGELAVPSVHIHLPIVKGITNYYLSIGAGEMRPEEKMGQGNFSLASHNFNNDIVLFSPLRHVQKGDKVYTTDRQYIYVYQVNKKYYVRPTQTEVIDSGKEAMITLLTCSMDGLTRLIVQGPLVQKIPWKAAPKSIIDLFHGPMNTKLT